MQDKSIIYQRLGSYFTFAALILLFSSCNPYGEKLEWKGKTLYYPKEFGKEKAQNLLNYLDSYFVDSIGEIRLCKEKDRWFLKIPIRKGTENNEEVIRQWKFRTTYLSIYVPEPDIELTDEKFNTVKVIPNALNEIGKPTPNALQEIGKPILEDQSVILFVLPPVTDTEAYTLRKWLRNFARKNSIESLVCQIKQEGNSYEFGFLVKDGLVFDDSQTLGFQVWGIVFSEEVFDGKNVDIRVMDKDFKTIRTFPYNKNYMPYYKYDKEQGQL